MSDETPGAWSGSHEETVSRELTASLQDMRPHLEAVVRAAKEAFVWRTIDDDLMVAQLLFDSAQNADLPLMRAGDPDEPRVLTFSTDLRSVELEVRVDRILGEFNPPSPGRVEVETVHGVVQDVTADDLGFFVIEPVPEGTVRLRCTTPTTRLLTEWIRF